MGRVFWVRDVQALYEALHAKGADDVYGPVIQTEYNMKKFAARDRDGYNDLAVGARRLFSSCLIICPTAPASPHRLPVQKVRAIARDATNV